MLIHLPVDRTQSVRDGLIAAVKTLPRELRRSITRDQGAEMAAHKSFTMATDIPAYFCDPASPWQRGSNEYTTGSCASTSPRAPISPSSPPLT